MPSYFLDLTVAIGNPNKEWVGTGFLYGNSIKNEVYLVTNKHILEDIHEKYNQIVVRFNDENSSEDFYVDLERNEAPTYFNHPINDIDISIIPYKKYFSRDKESKKPRSLKIIYADTTNITYTIAEMKVKSISEGDFIYTLGFPMGMDSINKKSPIVRTGCIARIDDLYNNESDQFLLDTFIFPGNSGSPVILKPESNVQARLIGIVDGYIDYKEELFTEKGVLRGTSVQNAGLAKVYPVDFINQTITAYEKGSHEINKNSGK